MNISLTPELRDFVAKKVDSDLYKSASEVVREGLRPLVKREHEQRLGFRFDNVDELKAKLQEGIDQIDRGESVRFDGEDELRGFFDDIKAKRKEAAGIKRSMSRVLISHHARQDLDDIWLYIASDNVESADRMMDLFQDKFRLLASQPMMGMVREDLAPGLRFSPSRQLSHLLSARRGREHSSGSSGESVNRSRLL